MAEEGLREAISLPAEQAGRSLDPAVVDLLVEQTLGREGVLPLLQFTLTELFDNRTSATVPLADYEAVGGVSGSLVSRADGLLVGLSPTAQDAARVGRGVEALRVARVDLDLDALLVESDVLTLHLPLTAGTAGLLDARRLGKMKRGAYLLNCSRGGLVDEPALHQALANGTIAGAGIDVLLAGFLSEEETGTFDHQIRTDVAPLQVGRITLGSQADLLAVNNQVVTVNCDITVEVTVDRVVLQHVGQIVRLQQVVDTNHFDILEVFRNSTERHTTDTAKPVDTDFNCHVFVSLILSI